MDTSPQQLLQNDSSTHPIMYTTKLKIRRFKTRAVFAIAPSTCATFSLHRAAAALLASMASWRVLTSGMKSQLSRRDISRSTLPGEIKLRRLPIRKERAEKLFSAWQLVDSIPLYSRAMSAKYGRPASTSPVSAQVLGLLLRSQNWRSEKVVLLEMRVLRQVHPHLLFNNCGPPHCSHQR